MNLDQTLALARADRLYPSLILHGSDREGRVEAALALAKTILCATQDGCGACRHCRRIAWPDDASGFHPDFHVLERDLATATSVDAARGFLRDAHVTPFEAGAQVFVVAAAETLTGEAANVLLKTLEEPPGTTRRHFLLLAPSQFDLLPTLRSRSLAIFLGGASRPRGAEVAAAADAFGRAVDVFLKRSDAGELVAAAAALAGEWSWNDVRSREPWEGAAAAVLARAESASSARERRALLALAADLVEGPRLRLRGIPADRILEGRIHRRLAPLAVARS